MSAARHSIPPTARSNEDGFAVLDDCHRQTLAALDKLAGLVAQLPETGADAQARAIADDVTRHFATTARQHHEDEMRHVFPGLIRDGDPDTIQAVLRLQRDHDWLEEDWMQLSPHLDAVASGQSWYDLDLLRDGVAAYCALMHDHIALEESLIYPQARANLREGERAEMGREMAARRRSQRRAV